MTVRNVTRLQRQSVELGIAERVDFPGATDRATTASLFRGADVFVLPSRHEPFGIVVLEALAAGVPTVAADVGGVGEFLPDTPLTRLVAPDQPTALAAGIDAVLAVDAPRPSSPAGRGRRAGRPHVDRARADLRTVLRRHRLPHLTRPPTAGRRLPR